MVSVINSLGLIFLDIQSVGGIYSTRNSTCSPSELPTFLAVSWRGGYFGCIGTFLSVSVYVLVLVDANSMLTPLLVAPSSALVHSIPTLPHWPGTQRIRDYHVFIVIISRHHVCLRIPAVSTIWTRWSAHVHSVTVCSLASALGWYWQWLVHVQWQGSFLLTWFVGIGVPCLFFMDYWTCILRTTGPVLHVIACHGMSWHGIKLLNPVRILAPVSFLFDPVRVWT